MARDYSQLSNSDLSQELQRARSGGTFGLAGGFFGRKLSLLEREAQRRSDTIAGNVFDMLDAQVENMRGLAATPEDLGIVANFDARARYARAVGSVENVDRQLELGAQWIQTQETQRIAADAAAQAQANLRSDQSLAAENLRFSRDMDLSMDLRKTVVNPYTAQMAQFNKAQELLATGDRLGYDFAFTMAIQALDGSVVREGERLSYTGSNGFTAQAVDLVNKWYGEKTPEVEAQLRRAIAAQHNAVVDTYREQIATYRSQTEAYGGDWGRVGSVVPPMEDWALPTTVDAPPDQEAARNPVTEAAAYGLAGAMVAINQIPESIRNAAGIAGASALGTGAVMSRGALIRGIMSRGGLAGLGAGGLAWLFGENARAVQDLTIRNSEESEDEYRQRVWEGIQGRSDVGAFLDPSMIKVPAQ